MTHSFDPRWSHFYGSLCYRSAAVVFDCGHPCFMNFDPIISIDVIRMKSYVDGLFNPTSVPECVESARSC